MNVGMVQIVRVLSIICVIILVSMNTVWIIMIYKIENNKVRVLKLYSEIRVTDAKLSL